MPGTALLLLSHRRICRALSTNVRRCHVWCRLWPSLADVLRFCCVFGLVQLFAAPKGHPEQHGQFSHLPPSKTYVLSSSHTRTFRILQTAVQVLYTSKATPQKTVAHAAARNQVSSDQTCWTHLPSTKALNSNHLTLSIQQVLKPCTLDRCAGCKVFSALCPGRFPLSGQRHPHQLI